ncbi:MAG TPA: riboflavin synthase [Armatimonadota bacterium]|nr:riboflavin synthase [Armatimonadota bacterium]HPO72966.1 riboflavin synthase [Armatimonadota bacterium]HPT99822.1 riboflavin synthase [Armatimonadota bacterium]
MFTGIVEAIGTVQEAVLTGGALRLTIEAPELLADAVVGESVSVNGVCLTVTTTGPRGACFDVVPETVRRTTLRMLRPGDRVNLERALRPTDRFGGHFVQGHVDAVGSVRALQRAGANYILEVDAPQEVTQFLVDKGSVAISGVSLTVVRVDANGFSVALIPHTLKVTTLGSLKPGDQVNLEADIIGKYVARFVARHSAGAGRADAELMRLLQEEGYIS